MSEDKRPDPLGEGHEPTEIAGPDGSGSTVKQAEFKPGELDGAPQEAQYQASEEVGDAYVEEPIAMIPSPEDGLPVPADESAAPATAPPYTYDTVVCIEDDRSFVSLYADEILGQWEERFDEISGTQNHGPAKHGIVKLLLFKHRSSSIRLFMPERYDSDGTELRRPTARPERVVKRYGARMVALTTEELLDYGIEATEERTRETHMLVRPVRPVCQHYRSQVFSNDDEPDPARPGHRIVFSNCMARRSVGGAMMSLRDEGVYACEHRSPPDPASVDRYLTQWNKDRLASARHLQMVSLFNLPPVTHRHAESGLAVKGPNGKPPAAPPTPKDPTP